DRDFRRIAHLRRRLVPRNPGHLRGSEDGLQGGTRPHGARHPHSGREEV
ncbi:MAG: hypothetical protein AVDCRST_MAG37-3582, partial [uncultured Rubrobacteraceae bacterium]